MLSWFREKSVLWKRLIAIIVNTATLLVLLVSPHAVSNDELQQIAQPYAHSVLRWEVANLWSKGIWRLKHLGGTGPSAEERISIVKDYFSLGQELSSIQREIDRVTIASPEEKANLESLRSRLAPLREEMAKQEDVVENTIEGHIRQVLAGEGLYMSLGLGSRTEFIFPPVAFELEDTPRILVISPRHTIELSRTLLLRPNLSLSEIEGIEREIEDMGLSALVEELSGMATYPSSIIEGASLKWVLDTVAHEWLHQYFFFRPLGRHYWSGGEMRIINETAAKMGGEEIGSLILKRYYGGEEAGRTEVGNPTAKPAFDFRKEMHEIRLAVEEYLSRGEVDEAEAFMKEKQGFLASKGYLIRKLNQAYFAFHGTYADSPTSISPIGGELAQLREQSASVGEFVKTVAQISSPDGLKRLLEATSSD